MNKYPIVSILSSKNQKGEWEMNLALKGKERKKALELILNGHTEVFTTFEDCKLLKYN